MLSKLQDIVSTSTRLLLYIDYLDLYEIYCISQDTSVDLDTCIETKCSNTCDVVSYLLNFQTTSNFKEFKKDKAYTIELQGMKDNELVNTSHMLILIYQDGWYLLDSYFNQRRFGYKKVDIDQINELLNQLKTRFSRNQWSLLTGDQEPEECDKIDVLIFEYDYETGNKRYSDLIKLAKEKLETEDGLSDEYLSLLSTSLDINEARKYLESVNTLM